MVVNTADVLIFKTLQVSNLAENMSKVINYFILKTRLRSKLASCHVDCANGAKITSDAKVLRTVAGEKIEFTSPPHQTCFTTNNASTQKNSVIAQEIQHLLAKEVIVEFVSAREELQCWVDCTDTAVNKIDRPDPQITTRTDASTQEWGCPVNDLSTGELWTATEKETYINYLELLAYNLIDS